MKSKFFATGILLVGMVLSFESTANELVTKVVQVGCHTSDSNCFVYIDKAIPAGVANCSNRGSLRWDASMAKNAPQVYATLLAAAMADKEVRFGGVDKACVRGYPTFEYVLIRK